MKVLLTLIQYYAAEIFLEYLSRSVQLLRSVGRGSFQLVLPSQGFVLVLSEGVVWEDFHSLNHPEAPEMLSKRPYVLFEVADSRNEHISEPERLSVVFKPLCRLQCLRVAASCQRFVP